MFHSEQDEDFSKWKSWPVKEFMDYWSWGGKKTPEFTGPNVSTYDPSAGR